MAGENKRKLDTVRVKQAKSKPQSDKTEPLLSILEPVEKNVVEEKTEKKPKKKIIKPHHKKIAGGVVFAAIVFLLGLFVAGAAYAHQSIYANKVYPGVVVWGEDVGGKSMTEVQELVTQKIKSFKVQVTGPDQDYEATAEDLGLVFNSETMALSAYSKGRTGSFWNNYITRARLLGTRLDWEPSQNFFRANELEIIPSYQVDDAVLSAYIEKLAENINISAKDSEVKVESGSVKLIPAIYGREVDKEKLRSDLSLAIKEFHSIEVDIETTKLTPKIIDESAQSVMVQAESVMSRPVTLTYEGKTFSPNKETVASWITFVKPSGAQNYKLVVEPARMKKYMTFLKSQLNIYPVSRKIRVKNGAEQTLMREGKDGLLIDEIALSKQIASSLPVEPSISLAVPMYVAKYKTEYEQVLVANWDKYIDIDLSSQTMTAYLKGGNPVGSWKVTTGNRYHPTPVGTWLVHGKSAVTRMTGGTWGVDYYDLPNVHWVTWFKGGGYSIHEAYWRSTFGGMDYVWNGSHGCVNSPYNVAKFIYDWAPIGTPVIVHY